MDYFNAALAGAKRYLGPDHTAQNETDLTPFALYRRIALCAHIEITDLINVDGPVLTVDLLQSDALQFIANLAYAQTTGVLPYPPENTLEGFVEELASAPLPEIQERVQATINPQHDIETRDSLTRGLTTAVEHWQSKNHTTVAQKSPFNRFFLKVATTNIYLCLLDHRQAVGYDNLYQGLYVCFQQENPTVHIRRTQWSKPETSTLAMAGTERAMLLAANNPDPALLERFEHKLLAEYKSPGKQLKEMIKRCNPTWRGNPDAMFATHVAKEITVEYYPDTDPVQFDLVVNTQGDGACLLHAYNFCINWVNYQIGHGLAFNTSFEEYLGALLYDTSPSVQYEFRKFEDLLDKGWIEVCVKHSFNEDFVEIDNLVAGQYAALVSWCDELHGPLSLDNSKVKAWTNGGELSYSLRASGDQREDLIALLYKRLAEGIRSTITSNRLVNFPEIGIKDNGSCSVRSIQADISKQFQLYNRALVCLDKRSGLRDTYHFYVGILFNDPFEDLPPAEPKAHELDALQVAKAIANSMEPSHRGIGNPGGAAAAADDDTQMQEAIALSLHPRFTDR